MTRRDDRGFTLIEMMVTLAISSVVLTAAVSVFIAMANQQRMGERLLEAQSSAMMGASMIQADVSNAGYRFPAAAFSMRYVNQVNNTTSLRSNGGPITEAGNCGSATGGLVDGTDVLEVATGLSEPGLISPGGVTPSGGNFQIRLMPVTGGVPPFIGSEACGGCGGVNSVLLFADKLNNTCIGSVTSFVGMDPVVSLLDRDYGTVATPATYYPSCPTPGMAVYRLAGRTRYMVCAQPGATPDKYGLYRQVAGPDGNWTAAFGTLQQDGVEDLQVSGRYSNAAGNIWPGLGSGASCTQGISAASSICYCDDAVAPSCTLPATQLEPGLTVLNANSMVTLVRGVRVQLTGVSLKTASTDRTINQNLRRPDSFDHAGMTAGQADNLMRVQQQVSVNLKNDQVVP